jgi:cystathionine gamma-synthase
MNGMFGAPSTAPSRGSWRRGCEPGVWGRAGGTLSVELHSEAAAKALPGKLLLFGDATSLGGVESLVEWRRKYAHPALQLN